MIRNVLRPEILCTCLPELFALVHRPSGTSRLGGGSAGQDGAAAPGPAAMLPASRNVFLCGFPDSNIPTMRRTGQIAGAVLLLLGVFWTGRESGHGITAFWEHWWCPIPLALTVLGLAALLVSRRPSAAS
jgi:hypothetical protein